MKHNEAYDLIESYVFGGLEAEETEALESHLEGGCEACLARLREVGEVSAQLAEALPRYQPADHVRDNIFLQIGSAGPRRGGSSRIGWVTSGVLAAALAFVMVWTASVQRQVSRLSHDLTEARQEADRLEGDLAAYRMSAELLGHPCTQLVDLNGVEPNPQASGTFMLHPHEPIGVAYLYNLPQAPDGMEYQLWFVRDGKPTSIGVFTVGEDGNAVLRVHSLPDPTSITEFQVTVEPAGGRPNPTGMVYLAGNNTVVEMD